MKHPTCGLLAAAPLAVAALATLAPLARAHDPSAGAPKHGNARFYELHGQHLKRAKQSMQLLFLGDSITEGWTKAPEIWKANYENTKRRTSASAATAPSTSSGASKTACSRARNRTSSC